MVNPKNKNGGQPSNVIGTGTVYATAIEPIPSTTSVMVIPTTMMVPTMQPEGTVLSPIL